MDGRTPALLCVLHHSSLPRHIKALDGRNKRSLDIHRGLMDRKCVCTCAACTCAACTCAACTCCFLSDNEQTPVIHLDILNLQKRGVIKSDDAQITATDATIISNSGVMTRGFQKNVLSRRAHACNMCVNTCSLETTEITTSNQTSPDQL